MCVSFEMQAGNWYVFVGLMQSYIEIITEGLLMVSVGKPKLIWKKITL